MGDAKVGWRKKQLGERQEIVYLPLPPGEGWGEGAFSRPTPRRTPSPPAPLPEGEGRNAGAARLSRLTVKAPGSGGTP